MVIIFGGGTLTNTQGTWTGSSKLIPVLESMIRRTSVNGSSPYPLADQVRTILATVGGTLVNEGTPSPYDPQRVY